MRSPGTEYLFLSKCCRPVDDRDNGRGIGQSCRSGILGCIGGHCHRERLAAAGEAVRNGKRGGGGGVGGGLEKTFGWFPRGGVCGGGGTGLQFSLRGKG